MTKEIEKIINKYADEYTNYPSQERHYILDSSFEELIKDIQSLIDQAKKEAVEEFKYNLLDYLESEKREVDRVYDIKIKFQGYNLKDIKDCENDVLQAAIDKVNEL